VKATIRWLANVSFLCFHHLPPLWSTYRLLAQ
jgi:hypothetical protein